MEKKIVSKNPDNEPKEAESILMLMLILILILISISISILILITACNKAEDIMLNLSHFKIFRIYIILFFK